MLQCPLPPAPSLDLSIAPDQFIIPALVMLSLALCGLLLPGKRRNGWRIVCAVLGGLLILGGYALGYGYGQHWHDSLVAWQNQTFSIHGCYSGQVGAFSLQEMAIAIHLTTIGSDAMFVGVYLGAVPSLLQLSEIITTWRRRAGRGNVR